MWFHYFCRANYIGFLNNVILDSLNLLKEWQTIKAAHSKTGKSEPTKNIHQSVNQQKTSINQLTNKKQTIMKTITCILAFTISFSAHLLAQGSCSKTPEQNDNES